MTIDTTELRTSARVIDPGLPRTARALIEAADEIDALRTALAASPHSTLCAYMVDQFHEPCSCWKADPTGAAVAGEKPIVPTFLDDALSNTRRISVRGPGGESIGLARVRGVRLEFNETHLTVHYENPEATT